MEEEQVWNLLPKKDFISLAIFCTIFTATKLKALWTAFQKLQDERHSSPSEMKTGPSAKFSLSKTAENLKGVKFELDSENSAQTRHL